MALSGRARRRHAAVPLSFKEAESFICEVMPTLRVPYLLVHGHDIVGGLALLPLASSHEELVAHIQVQAVAWVQLGSAP